MSPPTKILVGIRPRHHRRGWRLWRQSLDPASNSHLFMLSSLLDSTYILQRHSWQRDEVCHWQATASTERCFAEQRSLTAACHNCCTMNSTGLMYLNELFSGWLWRCIRVWNGCGPSCLNDLPIPVSVFTTHLRSSSRHLLVLPRCQLNQYGRRSFAVAGPVWNSLTDNIRDPTSVLTHSDTHWKRFSSRYISKFSALAVGSTFMRSTDSRVTLIKYYHWNAIIVVFKPTIGVNFHPVHGSWPDHFWGMVGSKHWWTRSSFGKVKKP